MLGKSHPAFLAHIPAMPEYAVYAPDSHSKGLAMTLTQKGKYWYGTTPQDLTAEIVRYSRLNGYEAVKFASAVCACGSRFFHLESDEDEGAARRTCASCGLVYPMGDSASYASKALFEGHECVCGSDEFELLSGVALYDQTNDVRWYYIGCRCTNCNLVP